MRKRIVIGSRSSKLALIQTESVVNSIREVNPDIEVSILHIMTKGDKNRHIDLNQMAGIGIFVTELEEYLLDGRIDIAVHSLKDMSTIIPVGLHIAAVPERVDPRDVLVSRGETLSELNAGSKIGTGSLRRAVQLGVRRPDLEICSIRGNVDTRMHKVDSGQYDGIIVAAAALKRLGWEHRINEYLPIEHYLPAIGQGALAIETRSGDKEINRIIAPLNHLTTWQSIIAERAFLRALGGGCRAPIAALGIVNGSDIRLEGMVADVKGKKILHSSGEGNNSEGEEIGIRLAQKLFDMGAKEFLVEASDK